MTRASIFGLFIVPLAALLLGPAEQVEARTRLAGVNAAKAALLKANATAAAVQGEYATEQAYSPLSGSCKPCIIYRTRGRQLACCGCEPPIQTILQVKDPASCCVVDVPVCLPGCCTDVPEVCDRCGLFGRGIVTYDWCCGFSVRVTFKLNGDVLVTYING